MPSLLIKQYVLSSFYIYQAFVEKLINEKWYILQSNVQYKERRDQNKGNTKNLALIINWVCNTLDVSSTSVERRCLLSISCSAYSAVTVVTFPELYLLMVVHSSSEPVSAAFPAHGFQECCFYHHTGHPDLYRTAAMDLILTLYISKFSFIFFITHLPFSQQALVSFLC